MASHPLKRRILQQLAFILCVLLGNVVRFGPNRITISTPEALQSIYGAQANTQKSRYYSVVDYFFGSPSTQTTIDKEGHARKRRILSRLLSNKSLKDAENIVHDNFEKFCRQLGVSIDSQIMQNTVDPNSDAACWSPPRDMSRLMSYLTFDIMGDLCFGRNFETLASAKNRDLIDIIQEGAQGLLAVRTSLSFDRS